MNTKLLSEKALSVIDQYEHFKIGSAICSIPYFNNRTKGARAKLRAQIGKGSPKDIFDEVETNALAERIDTRIFTDVTLKQFLVRKNIGIDCSGFVYYVLNAESQYRGKGTLDKHLHFPLTHGIIGKIRAKFRPVENTDVATFAHIKNSREILVKDALVGDIIAMVGGPDGQDRDHILVIDRIEYQNFIPITLHYVHAVAWPTDGEFGHGIHRGTIEITDINGRIIDQRWTELEKVGIENYTYTRGQKSVTTLRRLGFL